MFQIFKVPHHFELEEEALLQYQGIWWNIEHQIRENEDVVSFLRKGGNLIMKLACILNILDQLCQHFLENHTCEHTIVLNHKISAAILLQANNLSAYFTKQWHNIFTKEETQQSSK